VYVRPEWRDRLVPMHEDEADMLEVASEEPTEHSRLSCQLKVTDELDGLTVDVPATQR
jgi:2Fe-2S ferredoxin